MPTDAHRWPNLCSRLLDIACADLAFGLTLVRLFSARIFLRLAAGSSESALFQFLQVVPDLSRQGYTFIPALGEQLIELVLQLLPLQVRQYFVDAEEKVSDDHSACSKLLYTISVLYVVWAEDVTTAISVQGCDQVQHLFQSCRQRSDRFVVGS